MGRTRSLTFGLSFHGAALVCGLGAFAAGVEAASPPFTEFLIPTTPAVSTSITRGPDGNLWFTEYVGAKIGRITPAGVITEFAFPLGNPGPQRITAGPDGNVWFAAGQSSFGFGSTGVIGRVRPDGTITEIAIGHALEITTGPDGNLWVKLQVCSCGFHPTFTYRIIRCTPLGQCLPPAFELGSQTGEMTRGPDGNLWVCDNGLVRLTPTGAMTRIPVGCAGITVGPDSNMWASGGDRITRVTLPNYAAVAVYRTTTGEWLIRRPADGGLTLVGWGAPVLGDTPVPADYDGDGLADIAVYRRSTAEWFIRRSTDLGLTQVAWGSPFLADVPVPGDYDTDGVADMAVYRGLTGEWFIRRSSDGGLTQMGWGSPALGDVPVPARY